MESLCFQQLRFNNLFKPGIHHQTHHIIDLKVFAAFEETLAAETGIPKKNNSSI